MPFGKTFTVDNSGGTADYTTIQAAINAAVAAGAGVTATDPSRTEKVWVIEVHGDLYTEQIEVFSGILVKGQGRRTTLIKGRATLHQGARIQGFSIYPPDNSTDFALHCIGDHATASTMINDIGIYISNNNQFTPAAAVQLSGSTSTGSAIVFIQDCYFYARNVFQNGSGSRATGFRFLAGCTLWVEANTTHVKCSTHASATNRCNFAWNQSQSPLAAIQAANCDFAAFPGWSQNFAGSLRVFDNENTTGYVTGGMLDVVVTTWNSDPTELQFPGVDAFKFFSHVVNNFEARGRMTVRGPDGAVYSVNPTKTMNRAPTSADVVPPDTIWIVIPDP